MKQLLTIFMVFAVFVAYGQQNNEAMVHKLESAPVSADFDVKENDDEEEPVGMWIHWDDGVPFSALGLASPLEWATAARFTPDDIGAFEDWELTRVLIGVNHLPDFVDIVVWQGESEDEMEEMVRQNFEPESGWNMVELDAPYVIDVTKELWIGAVWGDPGDGYFPPLFDGGPVVPGKGGKLVFPYPEGDWANMEDFGFDGNWNIQGFIEGDYDVTFTLEMSYATVDGDDFDPENHDVYVSGTFNEWTMPGEDEEFKLEQMTDLGAQTILHADFDDGAIPDGWENLDLNNDGRYWHPVTTPAFDPYSGDYALRSESWAGTNIFQDNWIITPQIYVPFDDYELSFMVKAQDPGYAAEQYSVLVSTTPDFFDPEEDDEFMPDVFTTIHNETLSSADWQQVNLDLSEYEGDRIFIAFRHHDSHELSILLDDIQVTGTPPLLYEVAIENLELGVHEYKYFIVPDDPIWDYGEWEGEPNRGIIVTGEMAVHDLWAEQVVHELTFHVVDEAGEHLSGVDLMVNETEVAEEDSVYVVHKIEGIYEYTAMLEGYATVADEIELTGDLDVVVTMPLYRTLTFEIYNEDEEPIDHAVVTFDGIENPEGDYVFEDVVAGTYDVTIAADGYMTIMTEYTVTDDVEEIDVTATMVMEDAYYITFHLDMSGATFTAYGEEVPFDPDFHKVYFSGPDFPIPGSHPAFQLHHDDDSGLFTQTIPFAEGDYDYKYYIVIYGQTWDYPEWDGEPYRPLPVNEDLGDYEVSDIWDDYEEVPDPVLSIDEGFEDGVLPEHWRNVDHDGDGYLWTLGEVGEEGAVDGEYVMISQSWDGSPLTPDNWLITPQIDVAADDYMLTFWVKTQDPAWPAETYSIMVSTGEPVVPGQFEEIYNETLTEDDAEWKEVEVDLSEYHGELIFIAFRHWDSSDWFQIRLDAITVEGTPVGIDELEDNIVQLFPNPAVDRLTLRSQGNIDSVEIYNITGHKVYDAAVGATESVINVSGLSNGMYIMRVLTEDGIEHHKFQISK